MINPLRRNNKKANELWIFTLLIVLAVVLIFWLIWSFNDDSNARVNACKKIGFEDYIHSSSGNFCVKDATKYPIEIYCSGLKTKCVAILLK